MKTRRLGIVIVALAAVGPAVAQAGPGKTPLEACVKAFEQTLVSSDDVQHTFKFMPAKDDPVTSSLVQYYSIGYTFDLQAHDSKTGEVVGQARCLADSRGRVSSLSPLAPSQSTKRVAQN